MKENFTETRLILYLRLINSIKLIYLLIIWGIVFGTWGGIGIWFFGKVGGNALLWLWQFFMALITLLLVVCEVWWRVAAAVVTATFCCCWEFAFSPCTWRRFLNVTNSELRLRSRCCKCTASFDEDASVPPVK